MRRLTVLTAAALAAVSIGCQSATNTNVATTKPANANSNVAVVVPNNSNMAANTGMTNTVVTGASNTWNSSITREEYDKNKDDYANRAKSAGSTVGSGVNDGWIWTKTRSALATTNDLRDSTVNVDVDNGVITLKGTVGTAAQKSAAEAVAKGIDGQKGIKNELTVQAGDSLTNQTVGTGNTATSNANAKK